MNKFEIKQRMGVSHKVVKFKSTTLSRSNYDSINFNEIVSTPNSYDLNLIVVILIP